MLEQWQTSERLNLSLGARLEHTRIDPDAKGNATFASADNSESFTSASLSSGAVYQLDPVWSLAANLAYTERAPTFYELYANGAHVATGAFEVGDPNLNKEKPFPPTWPCASTMAPTRAAWACSTAIFATTSA